MKITLWGEFATSYSQLLSEASKTHKTILMTKLKVENFRGKFQNQEKCMMKASHCNNMFHVQEYTA